MYKKSSTGKTSEWKIYAWKNNIHDANYTVEHGYVDGKKQNTTVNVASGKNIGKKNETSAYEQACLEAESKWKKQLDKGYVENLQSVSQAKADRISPMLAHSYDDYAHKIKWPCYWQPKLDGVRCLAVKEDGKVVLLSRQGKKFNALPHIIAELEKIIPDGVVLDGELYVHGEEFQELIHLIKRDEPHEDSIKIEYHIYDCFKLNKEEEFQDRACNLIKLENLYNLQQETFVGIDKIRFVQTQTIKNETEMKLAQEWAEKNGYEGIMLRNATAPYKVGHRSHDLLKVKKFQDAEFEIVGGYENKGKQEGQCTLLCKTKDGTEFGVKPEGTDAQRKWYWQHLAEIKGKMLTVRFFSWTTSKNPVPRFPIGVAIRDYD